MVLKFFVQDGKIHLYTSLLSLLTCALVTLISALFPATVMIGLSPVVWLCCHVCVRMCVRARVCSRTHVYFASQWSSSRTKEISHVGINSQIADIWQSCWQASSFLPLHSLCFSSWVPGDYQLRSEWWLFVIWQQTTFLRRSLFLKTR